MTGVAHKVPSFWIIKTALVRPARICPIIQCRHGHLFDPVGQSVA
jgi:hypothetical protein